MNTRDPQSLAGMQQPLLALAKKAGDAILEVYAQDFSVERKLDESPVTAADIAAHKVICQGLSELTPDIPLISEEDGLPEFEERSKWPSYWLIDPLDGTKEFVNRNGEFTVNIALISDHVPVLGVVHVPVMDISYFGVPGAGALRFESNRSEAIHVSTQSASRLRVVGSRSHRGNSLDHWLASRGETEFVACGSSLKFCMVAEGKADVYPRFGPTSEWDTAAAQAVTVAAGGKVTRTDGSELQYNREANILNPFFIVSGPQDQDWLRDAPES